MGLNTAQNLLFVSSLGTSVSVISTANLSAAPVSVDVENRALRSPRQQRHGHGSFLP
jgi:hypothetical protein